MTLKSTITLIAVLLLLQATILHFMGQPFFCACGTITLWESEVLSPQMSQQLLDWYSFTHIIHGFLFYLLLKLIFPRLPFLTSLLMATGIEVAWEILENTPWLVQIYRQQALAQGYVGDSIVNSMLDVVCMVLGFILAKRWPLWLSLVFVLAIEIGLALVIRDNLTLNILNFIYAFDAIKQWQSGYN